MDHSLQDTVALLTRTPVALDTFLRDLPPVWTETTEGEGTWSVHTVIAHLIHCEHEDWMPRANMILQTGEAIPFTPLDREGHRRYSPGKSLAELLDQFANIRSRNLDALRALNLTSKDLSLRGIHPTFGIVTLSQLLDTWATHDLTHLHQISRVMACQYRETVGPWSQFQGVMKCTGRSGAA
jgi:hypothetical protein